MSHVHVIYPHARFDAALKILAAMYAPSYFNPGPIVRKAMIREAIEATDELIEACGMERFNPIAPNEVTEFNSIMEIAQAFSEEVNPRENKNPGV